MVWMIVKKFFKASRVMPSHKQKSVTMMKGEEEEYAKLKVRHIEISICYRLNVCFQKLTHIDKGVYMGSVREKIYRLIPELYFLWCMS